MNIKTKTYLPRPSAASSEIMKDCLVLELKMSLDPAHLSLRFGCGPFYHLYVRQFQISAEEVSPTIDTVPDELAAFAGEQPDGVEEAAVEEGELDAAQFSDQEAEFGDGFMPDDLMSSEKIDGPKASYLSASCHVDTE